MGPPTGETMGACLTNVGVRISDGATINQAVCSLLGGGGQLGLPFVPAEVSLGESKLARLSKSTEGSHLLGKGKELSSLLSLGRELEDLSGGAGSLDLLDVGGRRVSDLTLLGLAFLAGEEHKLLFVGFDALNVRVHHVGVFVVSAVVNSNSDGASEGGSETGGLNLSEREASANAGLAGIPLGAGEDNGSQLAKGNGKAVGLLILSLLSSDLLVCGLVKVAFDSHLPVLSEMSLVEDIIVFYHVAY